VTVADLVAAITSAEEAEGPLVVGSTAAMAQLTAGSSD
jgi:hypothetical protein